MSLIYRMLCILATTLFASSAFATWGEDGVEDCSPFVAGDGGRLCNVYCGYSQAFNRFDLNRTDEGDASRLCHVIEWVFLRKHNELGAMPCELSCACNEAISEDGTTTGA